ncbi:MAG: outer membrane protein assembly factor BamE [Thiolinea sp.]
MEVQQGNYLTQEQLAQVRPGMSQEQVRAVLGTPLMTDDFHKNRWDYVFYIKEGTQISRQRGVTVFFDEQGRVRDLNVDQ